MVYEAIDAQYTGISGCHHPNPNVTSGKGIDAVGGDVARACGAGGCQVRGGAGWAVIQVVRVWYLVCLMASEPNPEVPGTPMRRPFKALIRPYEP